VEQVPGARRVSRREGVLVCADLLRRQARDRNLRALLPRGSRPEPARRANGEAVDPRRGDRDRAQPGGSEAARAQRDPGATRSGGDARTPQDLERLAGFAGAGRPGGPRPERQSGLEREPGLAGGGPRRQDHRLAAAPGRSGESARADRSAPLGLGHVGLRESPEAQGRLLSPPFLEGRAR
jgi:hypothetical protein